MKSLLDMKIFLPYYFIIYNALYLFTATIMKSNFNYNTLYFSSNVGFSGILFALRYLSSYSYDREAYFNAYGLINVQKKYLIFVDLLMTKLIMPNSSLYGHFFGILTGVIIKYLL